MKKKAKLILIANDIHSDQAQRIFKSKVDYSWLTKDEFYYLDSIQGEICHVNPASGGRLSTGYIDFIRNCIGHHLYAEIDGKLVATTNPLHWREDSKVGKIGLDFVERFVKESGKIDEIMIIVHDEVVNDNVPKLRTNRTVHISPVITPEKTYTERQLQMAYCLGFLNKELSIDEMFKEMIKLKDRFNLARKFIQDNK